MTLDRIAAIKFLMITKEGPLSRNPYRFSTSRPVFFVQLCYRNARFCLFSCTVVIEKGKKSSIILYDFEQNHKPYLPVLCRIINYII
jgi:hypothetical protein